VSAIERERERARARERLQRGLLGKYKYDDVCVCECVSGCVCATCVRACVSRGSCLCVLLSVCVCVCVRGTSFPISHSSKAQSYAWTLKSLGLSLEIMSTLKQQEKEGVWAEALWGGYNE